MPDHSAQQTYASANGGYFDRLECLADPWSCLPNYQQNTTQARAVLQRVLDGRLIFTQMGMDIPSWVRRDSTDYSPESWHLHPRGSKKGTFAAPSTSLQEHTFDANYGRLLERATATAARRRLSGKRLVSPAGVEPASSP